MQANAAKADGQRAWWKLPRGNWRALSIISVLRVRSLANGRLECLNKRGLCAGKCSKGWRPEGWVQVSARELEGFKRFKGFKGTRKGYVQTNVAKADGQRAWWKLLWGNWRVLRVWFLANGRLEYPNNRGLCAGKEQAAMLEQQKAYGQRAWWNLPRGNWMVLSIWSLINGRLEYFNKKGFG